LLSVLTLALAVAYFSIFEVPVPSRVLQRISDSVSNDDLLIRIEKGRFRLFGKLKLSGIKVFDKKKITAESVFSVEKAEVEFRTLRIDSDPKIHVKEITLTRLKYPRLPDGYYIPDSVEFPGSPDYKETNGRLEIELPEIEPFKLTLVEPDILGIAPLKVDAQLVSSTKTSLSINDILIIWPDVDEETKEPMTLNGFCSLDLSKQILQGRVAGLARQHNIRPMLVALDITNSFPYMDGFTNVKPPVEASCDFDVNLRNNDLHLHLELHPKGGEYNKIPLKYAKGPLDIRVFVRDTFQNAKITVGPLDVELADKAKMTGSVIYENTNDIGFINFDVRSNSSLSNALAIADVLTDGTLDCLQPGPSPYITLKGRLASYPHNAHLNDLSGTLSFNEGTLFGIPLRAAETTFALKETRITFTNARASAKHGGSITGTGEISAPGFVRDNATYKVDIKGENIEISDAADVFSFDIGERKGLLAGELSLQGPLSTNSLSKITGQGKIAVTKTFLTELNIFKGLAKELVSLIPGLDENAVGDNSSLHDHSASCSFTVKDGKIFSDDILIEGSFLSIAAKGNYDMANDKLDFHCRVRFFKNDTFMAKLTRPLTIALSKYLLEFSLGGDLKNPTWKYIPIFNSPFDFLKKKEN
jgi:hypothetical protein